MHSFLRRMREDRSQVSDVDSHGIHHCRRCFTSEDPRPNELYLFPSHGYRACNCFSNNQQACAFSVPHIMIARYITGIGTGIETSTVPMYQSELCEASKRGRLVSSEPLFVGVGIVIAYWFDYGMSFVSSPAAVAWRLPIACQVLFAFVRRFSPSRSGLLYSAKPDLTGCHFPRLWTARITEIPLCAWQGRRGTRGSLQSLRSAAGRSQDPQGGE